MVGYFEKKGSGRPAPSKSTMVTFKRIKLLGQGAFGAAVLVEKEGKQYVLKEVRLNGMSVKDKKAAEKEATILRKLEHPNIIRYYDSGISEMKLWILMELAKDGDLFELVAKARTDSKKLHEPQVLGIFVQITGAIDYLHQKHILHRDLKSKNIFLGGQRKLSQNNIPIIKVGDFGIAKVLDGTAALAKTQIGTPYYLSPEICRDQPYGTKSDVWALGCLLYEMVAKKLPFNGRDLRGLATEIMKARTPPLTGPFRQNERMTKLFQSLLEKNPEKRPSTDKILKSEALASYVADLLPNNTECTTDDDSMAMKGEGTDTEDPRASNLRGYSPSRGTRKRQQPPTPDSSVKKQISKKPYGSSVPKVQVSDDEAGSEYFRSKPRQLPVAPPSPRTVRPDRWRQQGPSSRTSSIQRQNSREYYQHAGQQHLQARPEPQSHQGYNVRASGQGNNQQPGSPRRQVVESNRNNWERPSNIDFDEQFGIQKGKHNAAPNSYNSKNQHNQQQYARRPMNQAGLQPLPTANAPPPKAPSYVDDTHDPRNRGGLSNPNLQAHAWWQTPAGQSYLDSRSAAQRNKLQVDREMMGSDGMESNRTPTPDFRHRVGASVPKETHSEPGIDRNLEGLTPVEAAKRRKAIAKEDEIRKQKQALEAARKQAHQDRVQLKERMVELDGSKRVPWKAPQKRDEIEELEVQIRKDVERLLLARDNYQANRGVRRQDNHENYNPSQHGAMRRGRRY
eukprot:m.31037 g.31037  ORF g.31037 m.31037 type:complete len:734 (-) comp8273_c0_seq2:77-2278(-)